MILIQVGHAERGGHFPHEKWKQKWNFSFNYCALESLLLYRPPLVNKEAHKSPSKSRIHPLYFSIRPLLGLRFNIKAFYRSHVPSFLPLDGLHWSPLLMFLHILIMVDMYIHTW